MMKAFLAASIGLLALLCWTPVGFASSGNGVDQLEWRNSKEVLEYHSCGCADSCWVAEVKNRKTRQLKAQLRCDCEKTYATINGVERLYQENCHRFETDQKFETIRDSLELILRHRSSAWERCRLC